VAKKPAGDEASRPDANDPGRTLAETRRQRRDARKNAKAAGKVQLANPQWFVPVMIGLFVVGLAWIVVFYLSQQLYPIPNLGVWNLVIGFGILMSGFLMSTRWK
jgi:hypothetical protein